MASTLGYVFNGYSYDNTTFYLYNYSTNGGVNDTFGFVEIDSSTKIIRWLPGTTGNVRITEMRLEGANNDTCIAFDPTNPTDLEEFTITNYSNPSAGNRNVVFKYSASADNGIKMYYRTAASTLLEPLTDNTIQLGNSGRRWGEIWGSAITSSGEQYKDDIQDNSLGLDFILQLQPVSYKWKAYNISWYDGGEQRPEGTGDNQLHTDFIDKSDETHFGFIAQQVPDTFTGKVVDTYKYDITLNSLLEGDDKLYGLRYEEFIPVLCKAIQELDLLIEGL